MAGLAVIRHSGFEDGQLFLAEVDGAHRLGLVQRGLAFSSTSTRRDGLLVAAGGRSCCSGAGFSDRAQVGQAQLGLDDLDVGDRVDLAGHVDDVRVLEAAHHVDDGVGLADVAQELVAQAFALAGTGHQAGDVHELHDGGRMRSGLTISASFLQPRVGHARPCRHWARWCRTGSSRRRCRLGQGVEEGGLADVGQATMPHLRLMGGFLETGARPNGPLLKTRVRCRLLAMPLCNRDANPWTS